MSQGAVIGNCGTNCGLGALTAYGVHMNRAAG